MADRPIARIFSSPEQEHQLFHTNANRLHVQYKILLQTARNIVQDCATCVPFHLTTSPQGTNLRGLQASELWQADFTHCKLPPFKLLFVVIDTFSGFIWAIPSTAKTTKTAVTALPQCFSMMGIPASIKTNNGPAFTANAFRDFIHQWDICHLTGIPYNPLGQTIIERAHHTLKLIINKQNRGSKLRDPYGPKAILPIALLTINYFNLPLHSQETQG